MDLLQMSITGGCIILVIVLIRALAMNRLPKWSLLALWDLALLRLLTPFEFPFRFSVYSLLERAADADMLLPDTPPAQAVGNAAGLLEGGVAAPASGGYVSLWQIFWLAGVAAAALYFTVAYILHRRIFRSAIRVENGFTRVWLAGHKLRRPIAIRQSEQITAPLTYGVFYPVIVVPLGLDWSDADTLACVFTHEWTHIRRFDALRRLLLVTALCFHWFNPLVWLMYFLARRDMELVCDEAAVRQLGVDNRRTYALALLAMEETRLRLRTFTNGFGKNSAEERLRAVMKVKKPSVFRAMLALAVIVCVFALFCTTPAAAVAEGPNSVIPAVDPEDPNSVRPTVGREDPALVATIPEKGTDSAIPDDSVFEAWELRHLNARRLRADSAYRSGCIYFGSDRSALPVAKLNAGWNCRIRLSYNCTYGDGSMEFVLLNRNTGDLFSAEVVVVDGIKYIYFTAPTSGYYYLLLRHADGNGRLRFTFGTVVTVTGGESYYVSGHRVTSSTTGSMV